MTYLERLKSRNMATQGTDKADKSPFVSFVSMAGAPIAAFGEQDDADLFGLIDIVARRFNAAPEEIAIMKRLALADRPAAWSAFRLTAYLEGIR